MKERARQWLDELWREMRNGVEQEDRAYHVGAVETLAAIGILNAEERDGWLARMKRCPGHDDEGGRNWCAYGCDMKQEQRVHD